MKAPCRILGVMLLLTLCAGAGSAQRPRVVGETADGGDSKTARPSPAAAPGTVKAKYEGGLFGYPKKVDGTLSFDDANRRLLFRKQDQKELFSIPYAAVAAAFADTQSKRPKAADVIGGASIFTLPAKLIKKKYRYLTLQYKDPDTQASGTTSFKMQSKEVLDAVLAALANKAELTPRGEIYVKRRDSSTTVPTQ